MQISTDRLDALEAKVASMEDNMERNACVIAKIDASTSGIVEAFQALEGGVKVMQWIGKLAKPIGWIVAMCTAIAVAWTKLRNDWL